MGITKKIPSTLYADNKFCPGCGHGLINRLLVEVLEEMALDKDTMISMAVGCGGLMADSVGLDTIQAQHGRAPAVATGIKRVRPDKIVITYQGDGDAAAIGIAETICAASRNEKITTIFVNNGIFGMTGGQMSPTTMPGQKTTTSIKGKNPDLTGKPIKMAELLNSFDVAYIARGAISSVKEIARTKKYLKKALEAQVNGDGYSFVEILSPCPTNWFMSPLEAMKRIETEIIPYYALGQIQENGEREQ